MRFLPGIIKLNHSNFMQHKSSPKKPHCQAPAQTPEQKRILQLERRLLENKKATRIYRKSLNEVFGQLAESRDKIKVYEAEAEKWKVLCSLTHVTNIIANNNTDYWQRECERLRNQSAAKPAAKPDSRSTLIEQSRISLICIKPGRLDVTYPDGTHREVVDTDLEHLARYTATRVVKDTDGLLCYSIKELGGALKLADRFHVSTEKALPNSKSPNF